MLIKHFATKHQPRYNQPMKRLLAIVALLSISLMLSACGFHLRSSQQLPPQMSSIYLKTKDPYSPFVIALKQTLTSGGVNLVANQMQAPITLDLTNISFKYYSPTLGNSSLARTYNFYGSLTYRLTNNKNKVLLAPQTITSSRSLTLNANQLLDNNNQSKLLKQAMVQEMVNELFNRLSSQQTHLAVNPIKPNKQSNPSKR